MLCDTHTHTHTDVHARGGLNLLEKKLPMQGAMQNWRKAVNEGEHWIEDAGEQKEENVLFAEMPLTEVRCPECQAAHQTRKLQLKGQIGFSCLTCQVCRSVNQMAMSMPGYVP